MDAADWPTYTLDELGYVGRGKSRHRPRNDPKLYGGPYPFIQTADVMAADPYIITFNKSYSELGFKQSKMWPEGTLCMTIAGANTAETAILKIEACFPDSVVGFIADPEKVDTLFVKHALDMIKNSFLSVSRGATQDNLSLDKLLSFAFPVPPLEIQQNIVKSLKSYDDLVGLNVRKIDTLEAIHKLLFDQLVTDPGSAEQVRLKDFVDFTRGTEPGSKNYKTTQDSDSIPFLRVGDLSKRNSGLYVDIALVKNKILRSTDIVITLDGTVGIVTMGLEGAYSTGIRKIIVKNGLLPLSFVYQLLKSDSIQDTIRAHARGTTIIHASSAIDYMTFLLPSQAKLDAYAKVADPIFNELVLLKQQGQRTREIQTSLVPKLIAGELEAVYA
jgi:type I restriction enzyme S subunit